MSFIKKVIKALTQDSTVWTYGLIGSILSEVVAFTDILGPKPSRILALISTILLGASAYFKASPLPRKQWTTEERTNNGG